MFVKRSIVRNKKTKCEIAIIYMAISILGYIDERISVSLSGWLFCYGISRPDMFIPDKTILRQLLNMKIFCTFARC